MKIVILPRTPTEMISGDIRTTHAVISITDPTSENANLKPNPNRIGTLFLKFYDIDVLQPVYEEHIEEIYDEYSDGLFNKDQAALILDFVDGIRDKVKNILIHCDAGISRSAGVGAALSLIINGSDKEVFNDRRYLPNMFVYRTILNLWQDKEQ